MKRLSFLLIIAIGCISMVATANSGQALTDDIMETVDFDIGFTAGVATSPESIMLSVSNCYVYGTVCALLVVPKATNIDDTPEVDQYADTWQDPQGRMLDHRLKLKTEGLVGSFNRFS